jgi:hypothetical protein
MISINGIICKPNLQLNPMLIGPKGLIVKFEGRDVFRLIGLKKYYKNN